MDQLERIPSPTGHAIALRRQPGAGPAVVFLPGFNSDMAGSKAEYLAAWCAARARAYLRFDYSGHGLSAGRFADGSIGQWTADALAAIDTLPPGKLVLVGSSMGGWIALRAALARADRVAALVLLAPAPDFTEDLLWDALAPIERQALMRDGAVSTPNEYGPSLTITRRLIEEGRDHLLLRGPIHLDLPVRIIHGQQDPDVPWERSLTLAHCLTGNDVRAILVKDAGHRLSRPEDLGLLGDTLGALLGPQDGG